MREETIAEEPTAEGEPERHADEDTSLEERNDAGATRPRWFRREFTLLTLTCTIAVLATIAAITVGVLWATDDSADQLTALRGREQTDAAAEDFAARYALAVSKVDYNSIDAWRTALETGVTDALKSKMDAAVTVVGPLLTEMQYTSTAKPLAAKVSQHVGDQYVVQVFVDMNSHSRQTPDGVSATASYTVTLDHPNAWTITDVGGVGAGLPGGQTTGPGH
ncbi:hypothetical protein [Nocardia vaccinii]|uniref:hypothetical protein n=1 Tax=Nocardia vaccinii TaxID=1822 RepID=UPI0008328730|nr:hypothetical protein [Nocardia vaccinii]